MGEKDKSQNKCQVKQVISQGQGCVGICVFLMSSGESRNHTSVWADGSLLEHRLTERKPLRGQTPRTETKFYPLPLSSLRNVWTERISEYFPKYPFVQSSNRVFRVSLSCGGKYQECSKINHDKDCFTSGTQNNDTKFHRYYLFCCRLLFKKY